MARIYRGPSRWKHHRTQICNITIRGKQLVVLIGQPRACALAVRNVRAMRRLTNLAARRRRASSHLATPP